MLIVLDIVITRTIHLSFKEKRKLKMLQNSFLFAVWNDGGQSCKKVDIFTQMKFEVQNLTPAEGWRKLV